MGKPEGKIEDYLIKQAEQNNCLCYKFVSPGKSGVPDRIVIAPPNKTLFVEVKAPNGKLRPLQKCVIRKMMQYGAPVFVTHTKQAVDEFIYFITKNDYDFICNHDHIPDIIKPETYF